MYIATKRAALLLRMVQRSNFALNTGYPHRVCLMVFFNPYNEILKQNLK